MALFSTQFSRLNPLTFEGTGPFAVLISTLADQARGYLVSIESREYLVSVCRKIEQEIVKTVPDPDLRLDFVFGEMGLLQSAITKGDDSLWFRLPLVSYPWESYAAYALWKLIDACDQTRAIGKSVTNPEQIHLVEANINLALASTALQVCGRSFGASREHTIVMRSTKDARSNKARKNVKAKWKSRDEHMAFALELIPTIKTKYRIESARKIARRIRDKFQIQYSIDTVNRWLRAATWESNI